jgi:L-ascorbate metabolism protein UlaG (beta-lactamase superfamily)
MIVGSVMILTIVFGLIYMNTSPQFGGSHSDADKLRFKASGHYENNKFHNLIPTELDMGWRNVLNMSKQYFKGNPNKSPKKALPQKELDTAFWNSKTDDMLMWFGHSAFLLKLNGKNILLDPMLGESPAPHPTIGTKRYSKSLPVEIEGLPLIDLILISHDHYDHLDYESILSLKEKTEMFFVPLGVGAHLAKWGVDSAKIREFNWWDEASFKSVELVFTPARHFSGRKLGNNFTSMWGSWVIKGDSSKIYFSGDSGYGPHFKEIGEAYGPFDLALMECGQYNQNWNEIHMMPEETVQAAIDVQSEVFMPIHWGAFTLALHDWNEPPSVSTKTAFKKSVRCITPLIGSVMSLKALPQQADEWWRGI